MKHMKKISLQEALEGLEDIRRARSVMYPLSEILIIMLLAVICGATSYAKIEMFGKSKEAWLRKFLKLENGIPDACTTRDVIRQINTEELHRIFADWMKSVAQNVFGVVAIDGKEARRTKDENTRPLHVVSAFSHSFGLVLGHVACSEKSNEITAIPKLLELLEIEGCIVTIDAMGCQKDIAKQIIKAGADYCLGLKGNQTGLHEDVKLYFEHINVEKKTLTKEKGHGRIETREYFLETSIDWLQQKSDWTGLNAIGMVKSSVYEKDILREETRYFITSLTNTEAFARAVRSHWSIENNLHWCLDVAFREDESRARKDNSAENLNVFRQMAFNILKAETSIKGSFSDKQFNCLLDERYLKKVVRAWICSYCLLAQKLCHKFKKS
jgi:predicted transposase YbfD/YdcC